MSSGQKQEVPRSHPLDDSPGYAGDSLHRGAQLRVPLVREEDFINCLRQRNCIGMVAEHDDRVVGFMIYELNKTRIQVLNFAVAEKYRRHGVGAQMMAKLVGQAVVAAAQPDHAGSPRDQFAGPAFLPDQRVPRRSPCCASSTPIRPKMHI